MARLIWTLRRLDFDPVMVFLLLGMLAIRLAITYNLRYRRRIVARMTREPRPSLREMIVSWLDAGMISAGLLLLVIRPFVLQVLEVNSSAMQPTLHGSLTPQIDGPNDKVLVNKYLYRIRAPRRGELVAYRDIDPFSPDPGATVVKRLVALPGDLVEIDRDGRLVVNGVVQDEPYLEAVSSATFPARQVPADEVLVLGDSRDQPQPDQPWLESPLLPAALVRGKVLAICWPPERIRLFP